MYRDLRGLEVHASAQDRVEQFDRAVAAYLGARRDTQDLTDRLTAADPECALAQVLNGYLAMHTARREGVARAQTSLVRAQSCIDALSLRERLHLQALEAWIGAELENAVACWESILRQFPHDLLAIRLAQFMTSYLGRSREILSSIERVIGRWDPAVPGYGHLLGCYAYGLEEAGEYSLAEIMGRTAVDADPTDLWAAHAVAHVMEMQGRPLDGLAWVAQLAPGWSICGNFVLHVQWHRALFLQSLGDFDQALAVYDREVQADASTEYLDIANAASLLWRLEQENVDVGSRWEELAQRAAGRQDDHLFVFADLHFILALATARNGQGEEFLASCERFAESGRGTQARVMQEVGLTVAAAVLAHRKREWKQAAQRLLPARDRIRRIGGSHAQRDTFERLLIDATIRSGEIAAARRLLTERTATRPGDVWAWRALRHLSETQGWPEDLARAECGLAALENRARPQP
ncbi:MAG TPA: tetratricopeptide repeat protein [Acidobacteriaceae bacterium]|nr:tetratricopeptide repeat protein [Acidobacteriaceae bacterium]